MTRFLLPAPELSSRPATTPEPVGADYIVIAAVSHTRDGWTTTRQIPAFILPGGVLGIVGVAHARKIADEMLREIAGVTFHSLSLSVTRVD